MLTRERKTSVTRNPDDTSTNSPAEPVDPRIYFAAERTQLAWVRTALSLMGFGFVVARFGLFLREVASVRGDRPIAHTGLSLWIGTSLVLLGVIANVLSAIRQIQFTRGFGAAALPRPAWFWTVGVALAFMLAAIGLAMAIYLIVVG